MGTSPGVAIFPDDILLSIFPPISAELRRYTDNRNHQAYTMERNFDLIQMILETFESAEGRSAQLREEELGDDFELETVIHHLELMEEESFIKGFDHSQPWVDTSDESKGRFNLLTIQGITWKGYDLLEEVRG